MQKKRAIHLAPFNRNVGDNALNIAIEQMLAPMLDIEQMELVANPFDDEVFRRLNETDVVIFGGGGVIHSCSGDASRKNREKTGTMWNMDLDKIRALSSKVVLYCVGYNRFQGEPEPLPAMGDFFSVLNEKKALVRFRNDGSLTRFLEFFPDFGGIRVAPDPGAFCRGDAAPGDHVLVQIATDRLKFRFPNGISEFVSSLNVLLSRVPQRKILVPHTNSDEKIYRSIADSLEVDEVQSVKVSLSDTMEIMNLYRSALFTISMRGHSQICSIGNGTPTFAVSTHPKAKGYMIENGMPGAYFDYLNEALPVGLKKFEEFMLALEPMRRHIAAVNVGFDAEIAAFNASIQRYVYENEHEAPLITESRRVERSPAGGGANLEQSSSRKSGAGARTASKNKGAKAAPPRKQRTRGFVIASDANYFPGVKGCVAAIRRYNKYPIAFFDTGVTAGQRRELEGLVDRVVDVNFVHDLKVPTSKHTAHLNKSALSSLYGHLSGFDDILYIDVDALVLGNLDGMFDALSAHDIAGVRGNQLGAYFDGSKHDVGKELTSSGVDFVKNLLSSFDPEGVAINSGCFAARAETLLAWQPHIQALLPALPEFKLVDQSMINVLLQLARCRLELMDRSYNLMGLQFLEASRDKFELNANIDSEKCELYFAGDRVRVAHFSGRSKPWAVVDDSVGSLAWRWHLEDTVLGRAKIAARHALRLESLGYKGTAAAQIEGLGFLECARIAREMLAIGDVKSAGPLLRDIAAKHPNIKAVQRALAIVDSHCGKAVEALEQLDQVVADGTVKDGLANARRAELIEAFASGSEVIELSSDIAVIRSAYGSAAGVDSPAAVPRMRPATVAQLRSARTMLGTANALNCAGVRVHPASILTELKANAVLWSAVVASDKARAAARLEALTSDVTGALINPSGRVMQVGSGSGVFLDSLGTVLNGRCFALDPMPDLSDSVVAEQIVRETVCPKFYSGEMSFDVIVLHDILSRSEAADDVLSACAALLTDDGVLVVSDAPRGEISLEGLVLNPIRRVFDWQALSKATSGAGLELAASHLVDGVATYVFGVGAGSRKMPAEMAASVLIDVVKAGRPRASRTKREAQIETAEIGDWVASAPAPSVFNSKRRAIVIGSEFGSTADMEISDVLIQELATKLAPGAKVLKFNPGSTEKSLKILPKDVFLLQDCSGHGPVWPVGGGADLYPGGPKLVVTGLSVERLDALSADVVRPLLERSAFVGAVTLESVKRLRALAADECAHRIHYLPPIAFSRGALGSYLADNAGSGGSKLVGLNISAAHIRARYGSATNDVVERLADVVTAIAAEGYILHYISHGDDDLIAALALQRKGGKDAVRIIRLESASLPDIHRVYRRLDLFVGMRAEPVFWASALGAPVRGLEGDPLLASFFDDIGCPGWLLDLGDVEFFEKARSVITSSAVRPSAEQAFNASVTHKLRKQFEFGIDIMRHLDFSA